MTLRFWTHERDEALRLAVTESEDVETFEKHLAQLDPTIDINKTNALGARINFLKLKPKWFPELDLKANNKYHNTINKLYVYEDKIFAHIILISKITKNKANLIYKHLEKILNCVRFLDYPGRFYPLIKSIKLLGIGNYNVKVKNSNTLVQYIRMKNPDEITLENIKRDIPSSIVYVDQFTEKSIIPLDMVPEIKPEIKPEITLKNEIDTLETQDQTHLFWTKERCDLLRSVVLRSNDLMEFKTKLLESDYRFSECSADSIYTHCAKLDLKPAYLASENKKPLSLYPLLISSIYLYKNCIYVHPAFIACILKNHSQIIHTELYKKEVPYIELKTAYCRYFDLLSSVRDIRKGSFNRLLLPESIYSKINVLLKSNSLTVQNIITAYPDKIIKLADHAIEKIGYENQEVKEEKTMPSTDVTTFPIPNAIRIDPATKPFPKVDVPITTLPIPDESTPSGYISGPSPTVITDTIKEQQFQHRMLVALIEFGLKELGENFVFSRLPGTYTAHELAEATLSVAKKNIKK